MRIAVVYSSRHGHVAAIAERLAAVAAIRHVACDVRDVRSAGAALDGCDAAIIAGSVHFGRHARPLRRFVERHLHWLTGNPAAFLSVSGSAATLDGVAKADEYIRGFLRATGWRPLWIHSAAGALVYSRYDPLTRFLMKFAARTAGRATQDVVYTNWTAIDEFMHQFIDSVERHVCAVREAKSVPM